MGDSLVFSSDQDTIVFNIDTLISIKYIDEEWGDCVRLLKTGTRTSNQSKGFVFSFDSRTTNHELFSSHYSIGHLDSNGTSTGNTDFHFRQVSGIVDIHYINRGSHLSYLDSVEFNGTTYSKVYQITIDSIYMRNYFDSLYLNDEFGVLGFYDNVHKVKYCRLGN